MHRIGSMIAAACTGEITIASKGVAMPAAPPPIPPLEIPVSVTAGMATTQNQGLVMISKLTRFLSLLFSRRHTRPLSHNLRLYRDPKRRVPLRCARAHDLRQKKKTPPGGGVFYYLLMQCLTFRPVERSLPTGLSD